MEFIKIVWIKRTQLDECDGWGSQRDKDQRNVMSQLKNSYLKQFILNLLFMPSFQ